MHYTATIRLRFAILTLALGLSLGSPGAPANAKDPAPDQLNLLLFTPLVKIYEGDTVSITFAVEDTTPQSAIPLAPLTPLDATIQATLGSASVQTDATGGTITYQAEKSGQETLTLQVRSPLGSGAGDMSFTVYPQPNYTLDFFLTSQDSDEAGTGFRALLSGSGKFSNTEDTPVNGSGEADLWFSLWAITQPYHCQLNPPVQGHTGFEIVPADPGELPPLAPLVQEPGYISPVDLSLTFEPMSLNGSTIECAGLGDITANFPWPAQQVDGDDYSLKNLHFPGEGGILPFQGSKTEGLIIVTRIQP